MYGSRYSPEDAQSQLLAALRREGGELARVELVLLTKLAPVMLQASLKALERQQRIRLFDENGLEMVSIW